MAMAESSSLGSLLGGREFSGSCERHGPYEGRIYRLGGVDRRTPCPACSAESAAKAVAQVATDRAKQRADRAADDAASALAVAKIPRRFIGKGFDNYVADGPKQVAALSICRQYAEDFDEHRRAGTGLTLSGGPGTGKSHLAAAIIHGIVPGHSALYATVSDILRSVRDTWRRDSAISTGKMVESLRNLDLLVLDEIGVQSGTDGEHTILYDVLDGRYRDCAPTILLTNLGAVAMQDAIGDRLFDRLRETSRWVQCDWQSHRRQRPR